LDFDAKDVIEEGKFTNRNGKDMSPRSLSSPLKSLGFKKSEPMKVDGKTKRCIPIEQEHIKKLFKRYGYAVTVDTVVTDTSMIINEGKEEVKIDKEAEGRANRIERNNRNSVTKTTGSKDNPFCPKCNSPTQKIDKGYKCIDPDCGGLVKWKTHIAKSIYTALFRVRFSASPFFLLIKRE